MEVFAVTLNSRKWAILLLFTAHFTAAPGTGLKSVGEETLLLAGKLEPVDPPVYRVVGTGDFGGEAAAIGRRLLAPFQLCLLCKCCAGSSCATVPCCFGIDCQLPNKPFGVCAFVPKTCNCGSCST